MNFNIFLIVKFLIFSQAMQEVRDSLTKSVKSITSKIASNAENALKLAQKLG